MSMRGPCGRSSSRWEPAHTACRTRGVPSRERGGEVALGFPCTFLVKTHHTVFRDHGMGLVEAVPGGEDGSGSRLSSAIADGVVHILGIRPFGAGDGGVLVPGPGVSG